MYIDSRQKGLHTPGLVFEDTNITMPDRFQHLNYTARF
jgi:hypothetical protein